MEALPTNCKAHQMDVSPQRDIRESSFRVPRLKLAGIRKSGQISATSRELETTPSWQMSRTSPGSDRRRISSTASKLQNQIALTAVGVISCDSSPGKVSTISDFRPYTAPTGDLLHSSSGTVNKELTLDNWPSTISQGSRTWIRTLEQALDARLST